MSRQAELSRDKMQAEIVRKAICYLPDEYRDTVVLADMNELSYKEISKVLKISLGMVYFRLSIGRRLAQHISKTMINL